MIMSYYNHRHVDRYVYIRQLQRWCRARSRLIIAPTLMRNSTRSCGHVICWHLKGCETMTELCKGSGYLVGITLLEEFIGKVLSMKSRAYFQDVSFFQSVSWFFPTFKQMFSHQRQMSAARSLWMPQRSQRKTRCSETSLGICGVIPGAYMPGNHVLAKASSSLGASFEGYSFDLTRVSRVVSCVKQNIQKSSSRFEIKVSYRWFFLKQFFFSSFHLFIPGSLGLIFWSRQEVAGFDASEAEQKADEERGSAEFYRCFCFGVVEVTISNEKRADVFLKIKSEVPPFFVM